ncbi:hypothetical protein LO762_09065 [Actinocorallia sp. API 0066]|uniref:hypothetical protein n=1 Tax=Actinocorallia sp. API 0066 TaxID=2896846 RepID=UPI001E5521ED|nr:hypothetical protein [Actinocorallia sp. API 0066]MCD0449337.1 hypothetical protein [Actinocorallia sp. API 0066]
MGGWSRRDVNRLRSRMSEQGRDVDDIAAEIRHLTRGSMLAAYRMACGLSQPEVVERYSAVAPRSVMDQPLLSRLEAFPAEGARTPLATQIITLAGLYGTRPLRLMDAVTLDLLDERERAVLIRCDAGFAPANVAPVVSRVPRESPETTSVSNARPRTATDDSLERQVEMAARRALSFAVTVEGSNVGPETLAQLRSEVTRVAHAYPRHGLPDVLGDLIDLQNVAFRLLEGRQRPSDTIDLYLMAGALSGMLAKASHDLGDPNAAMTQARTAYVCADNAGHDGLRAWTRCLQSMIGYWAGWPNEAIRYAGLGIEAAARAGGTASVWLPAQEARAWAVLGDAERAEEAIVRAVRARDAVRGDELDELGGIMAFPLPRQLYYVADTQVWLPNADDQVAGSAEAAIRAYEAAPAHERSFSDEAGARADLALARANRAEVEGAAEAIRPVLDLPAGQRIGGVTASVMRVHHALRGPRYRGNTLVKGFQTEIEDFCRFPVSAALPAGR